MRIDSFHSLIPHIKSNVMGEKTILVYFIKYKEDVERERERESEIERERKRKREREREKERKRESEQVV